MNSFQCDKIIDEIIVVIKTIWSFLWHDEQTIIKIFLLEVNLFPWLKCVVALSHKCDKINVKWNNHKLNHTLVLLRQLSEPISNEQPFQHSMERVVGAHLRLRQGSNSRPPVLWASAKFLIPLGSPILERNSCS